MSFTFCHARALHTGHIIPVPHAAFHTSPCQCTCSLHCNDLGEGGAGHIAKVLKRTKKQKLKKLE